MALLLNDLERLCDIDKSGDIQGDFSAFSCVSGQFSKEDNTQKSEFKKS